MSKIVVDTNILIDRPNIFSEFEKLIIPITVLQELDNLKNKKDTGFAARRAIHSINSNLNKITITGDIELTKNDDVILKAAVDNEAEILTSDIMMRIKAEYMGVELAKSDTKEYAGYKKVVMTEYDQSIFYQCQANNYDININEYLIIVDHNTKQVIDKLKWTKDGFKTLDYKKISSRYVDLVKAKNLEQELYMDMLQDKTTKIKVCTGGFGVGKDYLALATFLDLIDRGKYDKIIWLRNSVEVDGSDPIGFLPGTSDEKLIAYADIVSDFLGGREQLELLMKIGKIELVHPGFLRGRDLRNSIIYCSEAQNMTIKLVKLILGRVSENTVAFFNGDIQQTDKDLFKYDNGLYRMIDKFKNNRNFGYVKLETTERSEIAEMARLL